MRQAAATLPRPLLEICVEDVPGALAAARAGADRIEYCANLEVGGVTPPVEEVRELLGQLEGADLQILIRSREGNFVYSEAEIEQMCAQISDFEQVTADAPVTVGYVVGAITAEGQLDKVACERFRAAAAGKPLTFHRAFDELSDPIAAAVWLAEHGYNRILTTGLGVPQTSAAGVVSAAAAHADQIVERGYSLSGLAALQKAVDQLGLRILASGGLRPETWDKDLLAEAALREFHLRAPWAEGEAADPASGGVNPAVVRVMRKILS
ncbi:copper homeostasis protein CutC [Boudabousia marimammalium]|uniref:Copper homeostasis protein cutC homolog n=1 Tax=Boudabousia marimammalium TaxID=156892 RepID=A0A1Q5PT25_9ACTO|nr:copper homeostasis protein CutC [Boudabousia marimammalium]OKL50595.1 hypothetical protein BM477_01135 [Boudabousia marimammalium]